ncbi:hypothetical protein G6F22_018667 [Rhizopus arrhizus]|nr:hypothetical protein G6F22_018667 [Rhizopus arrhizus]
MLHEAQRTSAPRATSVSISTPVWMVMCRLPAIRAPLSGCAAANSSRMAIRPGISVSAMASSRRPQPASDRSATRLHVNIERRTIWPDNANTPRQSSARLSRHMRQR